MKKLLFIIPLFICFIVAAQNIEKDKVSKYVLSKYKSDSNDLKQSSVDTIIQLLNGNHFCLVKTIVHGSNAESEFFDCYELSVRQNKVITKNSILSVSNGTGGSGECEITYNLYYLDSVNYMLLVLKNVVHRGMYCSLYAIINSKTIAIEQEVLDDMTGYLGFADFDKSISVIKSGQYITGFYFTTLKMSSMDMPKYSITEKKYKVDGFKKSKLTFKNISVVRETKRTIILE